MIPSNQPRTVAAKMIDMSDACVEPTTQSSFQGTRIRGVDASGWLWEIERDGKRRRVLVEITGTARDARWLAPG